MKQLITIAIFLFCLQFYSCTTYIPTDGCQRPRLEDGKLNGILPVNGKWVSYSYSAAAGDLGKNEIYRRARRWMALYYRSSDDELQMEDKESGDLVSKSSVKLPIETDLAYNGYTLRFSLAVEAREGKYRVEVTALNLGTEMPVMQGRLYPVREIEIPIEQFCIGKKVNTNDIFKEVDKNVKAVLNQLSEAISAKDDW